MENSNILWFYFTLIIVSALKNVLDLIYTLKYDENITFYHVKTIIFTSVRLIDVRP